jgi:flagellar hook-associated protein 3 FlgL
MDRIATASAYDAAIQNLMDRQESLVTSQEQLTSGKRVNHASDDPTAAARAERARALVARTEATSRAVDASKNAMTLTESALGDATDLMQQARELVMAAGDASYSPAERASVGQQLSAIRKQLLSVANRPDGQGGYIFSGQGSGSAPFIDTPSTVSSNGTVSNGVKFTGVGGSVSVATQEPLPLTLDGKAIWLSANTGNGVFTTTTNTNSKAAWVDGGTVTDPSKITGANYQVTFNAGASGTTYSVLKDGVATPITNATFTSGQPIQVDGMSFTITGAPATGDQFDITKSQPSQSVFDTLDTIARALNPPQGTQPMTQAQITQVVQTGLRDIDQTSSSLQSARSFAGATLKQLDGVQGRLDADKLWGQTSESNAVDLDMVSALSSFQSQQTGYQAALQSYGAVQKMSLLQYLNA